MFFGSTSRSLFHPLYLRCITCMLISRVQNVHPRLTTPSFSSCIRRLFQRNREGSWRWNRISCINWETLQFVILRNYFNWYSASGTRDEVMKTIPDDGYTNMKAMTTTWDMGVCISSKAETTRIMIKEETNYKILMTYCGTNKKQRQSWSGNCSWCSPDKTNVNNGTENVWFDCSTYWDKHFFRRPTDASSHPQNEE